MVKQCISQIFAVNTDTNIDWLYVFEYVIYTYQSDTKNTKNTKTFKLLML